MNRRLVALTAAFVLMVSMAPPGLAGVRAPDPGTVTAPALTGPTSAVDQTKIPHYFGPYSNWANSPLTQPDATVTISPAGAPAASQTVGNPLIARQYASDDTVGGAGSGTPGQGTVLVIVPGGLPAGTLTNFQTYVQNLPALGSPGSTFNAYVLHSTGTLNEYSIVFDSGPLTVPAAGDGVHTWLVSAMPASTGSTTVQQGDVIGFYGQGIPLDVVGSDLVAYPVAAAPTSPFVTDTFPQIAGRTYSFGATIQLPGGTAAGAGATADAIVGANGAVTGLTITNPGHDYTAATVAITGAGSLATASADVQTSGVVTGVVVDIAGGGYTAPTATFSGGGATTQATGHPLGGVDAVNLSVTGVGYSFPTVDFDLPDDPNGVQAQGHAVCGAPHADCNRGTDTATMTVESIVVDNPGSGYATAPNVVVRDGTVFDPINPPSDFVAATGAATLSVLSVALDTFGAGYTSAPTVTFGDTFAVKGTGAHAVAATDYGAVVALHLLTPGSGYITPGGIKKFVDGLPGLTPAGVNNLGQYIPVAQPDKTTFAAAGKEADYYVIALVQHRERMSSSLPTAGTLLREYVQLETANVTGKHVALQTDLVDGSTTPVLMPDGSQAYGVDEPHFLGPTIVAQKDRAVRVVFYNLLPKGAAGNLFLPTDTTLMGSGETDSAPVMATDPNGTGNVLDVIRNPMCTVDPQMPDCYTQNRATLHLHGGVTPWISDGTPHQWITPAGDSTSYPQGVAVQDVPDMVGTGAPAGVPDCSADTDGCQTFYYTNQQSARLMFYHDHAWGITRLNVYAGEAAGYVITDPTEQKLFGAGGPYADMGEGIPLVIQDRTFVPSPDQLAGQDPTWDASKWGGMGNVWYEHVYMPAQNPSAPNGMNPYGRWFYGPWFWPPASPQNGAIANPYYQMDPKGPDGKMGVPGSPDAADDFTTPLATPCNLNDPTTWQYQVEPFCEPPTIPGTPNISVGMEQFNDTPIVNGTAYPTTTLDPKSYRFRILNAANDRVWNLSWYVADPNSVSTDLNGKGVAIGGTEVALKASELAAAQTDPNVVPTPDTAISPAGPDWIAIGSEGGFLPAPAVVPAQPTTWIIDPTRFDVGNVDKHSLVVAPAERSDVIVDFSKYAGKTLILYNDAPAAYPGRIAGYDYYTGMPDLGSGQVIPGYGPNTRTVMQVKIAGTPAPAFNLTALNNLFKHHADGSGVFESSQDPIIVGQAAYNSAYGTSFVKSGDCTNQTATNKCDGFARIAQQGGQTFRFDTLKGPQQKVLIEPKALHDEMNSAAFDEFGRMTSNLGLEAVPATPAGQNILLYPYIAPPTEVIDGTNLPVGDINVQAISSSTDGTQIWKITHNGVDTHPIHFHLFNVQILDRVTWDNIIIPPEASELGWKETIRVSPLEDTIVAVRPIIPTLPFEVPNSIRALNPSMKLGANLDPLGLVVDPSGNVTTITNALVNFGWEYVYHCHILSHEEMDMMRPMLLAVPPLKADTLAFDKATKTLTFNDNSITETSFAAQVSLDAGATWTTFGTLDSPLDQPNLHRTGVSIPYNAPFDPSKSYMFRVMARNTVGATDAVDPLLTGGYAGITVFSLSDPLTVAVPTTTTLTSAPNPSLVGENVTFTATVADASGIVPAGIPTGTVQFSIDGAAVGTPVALDGAGVATYATSTLTAGSHPVVATYNGVLPYGGSSGSLTQTVNQAGTATTLFSSLNPSTFGSSVTFTAQVTQLVGTVMPTGSVNFAVDGGAPTTVPLDGAGMATLTTTALAVGPHTITAHYPGNAAFLPSSATPLTQTVLQVVSTTLVTSNLNPSVFGDNVTFTATVTPLAATGTVEFFDGVTSLGPPVPLSGGTANLSTAALAVGNHPITAVYSGDVNNVASTSAVLTQSVIQLATVTSLVSSLNPSVVGDNVTFTATVSPSLAAGTVTFTVDAVAVTVPVVAGQAVFATTSMAIGNHAVTAAYSGGARYLPSTSPTITQVVGPFLRPTTTVVTSNRVPTANLGQNITFTATVRPVTGTGIPTGTVQFSIDGVNVGALVTLNAQGRATFATATLASGPHNVIATYSASAIFAGSGSATYVQVVNTATTTTVVTSNRNPSVFGQSVTLTARVTPSNGPVATGTVQFSIDGAPFGSPANLNATGRATLVLSGLSSLSVGTHTVSATYNGNGSDLPSTSATFTQTVNKASSRTVVTTSRTPTPQATPATLTATVTAVAPGAGIATGLVQFRVDGVNFGTAVALDPTGKASTTTTGIAVGRHTVTAVYAGDGSFNGSTSAGMTQRIQ